MVRVPLPQEPERVTGFNGFSAPGTAPQPDVASGQLVAFGESLQVAGFATARAAAELEETLHVAAVKEAQALAEERIGEADRGYLSTVGRNATGFAREKAWQGLRNQLMKIESGLEHRVQRDLFRQVMSRRMQGVRDRWGRHEIEQALVREIGASKAVLEAKKEAARRQGPQEPQEGRRAATGISVPGGRQDPERAGAAPPGLLESVVAEARSLAGKLGLGPEETDAFVREHTTDVHVGFVEDLLSEGRGSEARNYLEGVDPAQLDPGARRKLQDLTRRASLQHDSLARAFRIVDEADRHMALVAAEPGEDVSGILLGQLDRAVATSRELESFAERTLQQQFQAKEITAEEHDLTLNRVQQMAASRRQQAAEEENRILDEAEAWASANRDKGLADMPPTLFDGIVRAGRLPEISTFLRTGRHINDPSAVVRFMQLSTDELRAMTLEEARADLRTKMDNDTLNWAIGAIADAHRPGANAEAGMEKRLIEQAFIELGRPGSNLELRRGVAEDDPRDFTDLQGFFMTDLSQKLTPQQEERINRFWIRYNQLKTEARGNGEDITYEKVQQLIDRVLLEETAGVSFTFDDFEAAPVAALTGEELERTFATVGGEEIPLSDIPGTLRLPTGRVDVFGEGDVRGAIIAELQSRGVAWTPQRVADMWDFLGRPRNVTEYEAAFAAAKRTGDVATRQADRLAVQRALFEVRNPPTEAELEGRRSLQEHVERLIRGEPGETSPEAVRLIERLRSIMGRRQQEQRR